VEIDFKRREVKRIDVSCPVFELTDSVKITLRAISPVYLQHEDDLRIDDY